MSNLSHYIPDCNNNFMQEPSDPAYFDLNEAFHAVLKAKLFIAIFTISTIVVTCLAGWFLGSYKSEGYFQLVLSQLQFKRIQAGIGDAARWNNFAKMRQSSTLVGLERIVPMLQDKRQALQLIKPIYSATKADLKELPDAANKSLGTDIFGLTIAFTASNPKLAQNGVLVLGDYLRDTAILMNYRDDLFAQKVDLVNKQKKLENHAIDTRYELVQAESKRTSMQTILREYPESTKTDSRQLVSISEGNERYLSPVTQLVAIEAKIADMRRSLPRIVRDQRINSLLLSYQEKILALLDTSSSGEAFLKALPSARDALKLNLEDDLEKTVYNNITIAILDAQSLYYNKMRFIGEPTLPEQRNPGMLRLALSSLIVGFFLACTYVSIRHFLSKKEGRFLPPNFVKAAKQINTG